MDSRVQGQDTRHDKTKDKNNKDCEEKQHYDYQNLVKKKYFFKITKNLKKTKKKIILPFHESLKL